MGSRQAKTPAAPEPSTAPKSSTAPEPAAGSAVTPEPAGPPKYTERAATADQAPVTDLERLRFEVIRNGRYHGARRGWYEGLHRCMMFAVVIGGAGVVIRAVGDGPGLIALALVPTIAGTLDLVFGFGEKGAQHARLQERSYAVLADIEECAEGADTVCRRGWATLARIYAEETKTMRVVEAFAYNDTKEANEENAEGELLVVPWYAQRLRHLIAFDGLNLPRRKDVK